FPSWSPRPVPPGEVGYIRLRPPTIDRTRVDPSSVASAGGDDVALSIPISRSRSDVEFGRLDPVPEIGAGRLLQIARVHGLEAAQRDEVVLVIVRGEALHESLFGDVILAPGSLAAETFDRQPSHGVDHLVLRRPAAVRGFRGVLYRRLVPG